MVVTNHRITARPIINKPVEYNPASLEKLSQPLPKSANIKPMKSNSGRKVLGFDKLRPTCFTSRSLMFFRNRKLHAGGTVYLSFMEYGLQEFD